MRILFLANTYAPETGWGRYAEGFRAGLARLPGFETEAPAPAGLRSRRISMKQPLWSLFDAFGLYGSACRADVIHALTEPMAPLAWILSCLTGKPYVVSIAGSYGDLAVYPRSVRWLYRLAIGKATRLSVLSRYTKAVAERNFPSTPMTLVHGGFSSSDKVPDIKSRMSEPPRLLSVGAIKRRKGFHTLVAALGKLSKDGLRVRCDLVGPEDEPDYARAVEATIGTLGLAGDVVLRGKISEEALEAAYRDADLFVLPSEHAGAEFEGLGLVYLEALSHGVPVIGCLESGAVDVIQDGVNGRLVPPGNPGALAAAIHDIIGNPEKRRAMSEAARPSIERFRWDAVAEDMRRLYLDVLKR